MCFSVNAQTADIFDTYSSDTPSSTRLAKLDNFAISLQRNSDSIGYIIYSPGDDATARRMSSEAQKAKRYLNRVRGISANRIIIVLDDGQKPHGKIVLQPWSTNAPPLKFPTKKSRRS
jgi:hypothetical protein